MLPHFFLVTLLFRYFLLLDQRCLLPWVPLEGSCLVCEGVLWECSSEAAILF